MTSTRCWPDSIFEICDCGRPIFLATSIWVRPASTRAFRRRSTKYAYSLVWIDFSIPSTLYPETEYPNFGYYDMLNGKSSFWRRPGLRWDFASSIVLKGRKKEIQQTWQHY